MSSLETTHEVTQGNQSDLVRDLFHRQERRPQHPLRFPKPQFAQILARRPSGFLFEEVTKARGGEMYQFAERASVPRA